MVAPEDSPQRRAPAPPRWVNAADVLTLSLLSLAAYILLFGGIRTKPFGVRLSVSDPQRLLLEAGVVAALRHWRHRSPSLVRRLTEFVSSASRRWIKTAPRLEWIKTIGPATGIFAATRLPVLLVGFTAVVMIGYPNDAPLNWRASHDELVNLPARWDSGWYVQIAQYGYSYNPRVHGAQNIVFFPAYPVLMRAADALFSADVRLTELLWAGVVVSLVCFFVAIAYLYAWARTEIGDDEALLGATLLAAYPFALFYSAAYTESLFLLATVATFFHFSRGDVWRASAWGLLDGLTRPNGWMISISLSILTLPVILGPPGRLTRLLGTRESVTSALRKRSMFGLATAVFAPIAGLLIYCAFIYRLTGDPFTWAHLQVYWHRNFDGLSELQYEFSQMASGGLLAYIQQSPTNALNAMALVFGVASIWPVTRRLGAAYGLFVLVNIGLPIISGGLQSLGRFSAVLFPSFVWLGAATPRRARPAIVALFALGQGLAAALFFTWRPVY